MKIEKHEDGRIKKDITVPKVEQVEEVKPEPEQTTEQRMQILVEGFARHIQVGGDWREYIRENAETVDEAVELTQRYNNIELYNTNIIAKQREDSENAFLSNLYFSIGNRLRAKAI